MIFNFKVITRNNPQDLTAPRKFYPAAPQSRKYPLRALAEDISLSSSFSPSDVMGVLEALVSIVPKLVVDGKMVCLGDLGTFKASVLASGEATAAAVSSKNIRKVQMLFAPGPEVKRVLGNLQYKKIDESSNDTE